MIRQRALAWAAVLALVATVPFASLPIRHPVFVATALAQDTPATDAGEETELVVVALYCAEAPATEALAAYFSSGAPPTRCAPAVGVSIAVTENETPLPGSPFTTDVAGSLGVPVGLGSAVAVREDPGSLPSGYAPLTQEANGVPYANPVELDSAVAGAAVLFVNVPAAVAATLAQYTSATDASAPADALDAVTPDANAAARAATTTLTAASTPDRTGCDPAYPDASTCIPSGAPLAAPCAITEMRNFTVLAPDPRGLDADHDGIGCEPILPVSGTITTPTDLTLDTSAGSIPLPAPAASADAGARNVTAVTTPTRIGSGRQIQLQPWPRHRGTGIWTWPGHSRADTWHWPRHLSASIWDWPSRSHTDGAIWPGRISSGNLSIAVSGTTTFAISGSAVRLGNGVWFWTPSHPRAGDWRTQGNGLWVWPHDGIHSKDWRVNRTGSWLWSGAAARSGSGSVAVVGSAVRIGTGIWLLPPGRSRADGWLWPRHIGAGWPRHVGAGDWIWSGAVARSSSGSLAVSGSSVRIGNGLWLLPADRNHFDTWLGHGGGTRVATSSAEPLTINDSLTIEPAPAALEQDINREQPSLTIDDGLTVEPSPVDSVQPAGDGNAAPAGDVSAELPPDAAIESADTAAPDPGVVDSGYGAPEPSDVDPSYVAPEPSNDPVSVEPEPVYAEPEPISIEPEPVYAEPDPAYVAPEPVYSEPEPVYVDPGSVAPEPAYVDPGYAAPDPGYVEPVNVEPAFVDPGFADPSTGDFGNGDAGFVSPEPVFAAGADPGFGDPVIVAPDPGGDSGFGAADPIAVDSGSNELGNGDAGFGAADVGGDASNGAPDLNLGLGEGGAEDE